MRTLFWRFPARSVRRGDVVHHTEGATLSEGRQNSARRVPSPARWTSAKPCDDEPHRRCGCSSPANGAGHPPGSDSVQLGITSRARRTCNAKRRLSSRMRSAPIAGSSFSLETFSGQGQVKAKTADGPRPMQREPIVRRIGPGAVAALPRRQVASSAVALHNTPMRIAIVDESASRAAVIG